MTPRIPDLFAAVTSRGGLLPPDILIRVAETDAALGGLAPADYFLIEGERISEAVNRSWNRLRAAWIAFQKAREALGPGAPTTGMTRDRWLLPLFQELGYGRLQKARAVEIGKKSYAISHFWNHAPVHLLGASVPLDRRSPGVEGATVASPHGLVQEFLNRSSDHLWGFVSNGLTLRILRDSVRLTRQSLVEFDLESMMEGELYADFRLMWLVCHASRVSGETPEACRLERWRIAARDQGARILENLRLGVETAIARLGGGFLRHPANEALRASLRDGSLETQDYFRQLLRLVYRLLFLFVSEDRDLLLKPDAPERTTTVYARFYSTRRLREIAAGLRGGRHDDLFEALRLVMEKLAGEGCPELGLAPLGGFLFSAEALPDLLPRRIANADLLAAVRALSLIPGRDGLRPVDFRNLGAEELGSVYESLLELHPVLDAGAGTFALETVGGHERKTTGSYYTPDGLIQCLLDSALEPVLDAAVGKPDPAGAILALRVCDPACGSGHFLIGAANRMARRLAAVRTGEAEPSPEAVLTARREVIARCLYGVDVNPMAVELCKVNLWLESMEPGKPLSFLDHHIQCGNSLLGATPALLEAGIPEDAFKPIEGDDPAEAKAAKIQNRAERSDQKSLFTAESFPWERLGRLADEMARLNRGPADTIEGVREKQARFEDMVRSSGYEFGRLLADMWCAAFVWKKARDRSRPHAITEEAFRKAEANPHAAPGWMKAEVRRLAERYQFFHWHLAFPDVFRAPGTDETPDDPAVGWIGGFDVVLGNPPWERIKIQEKEWFARRRPEIADAPNTAARRRKIERLRETDPFLYEAFLRDKRKSEGESHFVRNSGRFPLCGRGDINTYSVFTETKRMVLSPKGRVGCIVPSGIATDDTTKFFIQDLMERKSLVSLYDFWEIRRFFPGTDSRSSFCLLTLTGAGKPAGEGAEFAFSLHDLQELNNPERRFTLSGDDLRRINPNTRTCPIFRTRRDAEITKRIYANVPVLIEEDREDGNPWEISFLRMFDMSNASHLFRTRETLEDEGWTPDQNVFEKDGDRYLPLYEAKMIHQFDHRFAGYGPGGKTRETDPEMKRLSFLEETRPRYWVPFLEIAKRAGSFPGNLVGFFENWKSAPDEARREKRRKTIQDILVPWLTGYFLNRGENEKGERIIRAITPKTASVRQGVIDLFAVQNMEERYPLTESEAEAIQGCLMGDFGFWMDVLIEERTPKWFLGWRDICRSTDERTVIASLVPRAGFGDTFLLLFPSSRFVSETLCLNGNLNSFVLDYFARQKIGGTHLKYHVFKQLPILEPDVYTEDCPWEPGVSNLEWLRLRLLELTYTALGLEDFARDQGYSGPPFRWDDERRFLLRRELDAAFFHLYGVEREEVAYIMETFPIVRRKDEQTRGEYRALRVILEIYDAMQTAIDTGEPYPTRLSPPPADPSVAHRAIMGDD